MKLNELKPALGSTTAPRRLGRGVGSGKIKFGDTVFLDESRKGLAGQGAAL